MVAAWDDHALSTVREFLYGTSPASAFGPRVSARIRPLIGPPSGQRGRHSRHCFSAREVSLAKFCRDDAQSHQRPALRSGVRSVGLDAARTLHRRNRRVLGTCRREEDCQRLREVFVVY